MGSLVGSHCFASNSDAVDAWFSQQGDSFTSDVTSFHSWFEKVGGVWNIKRESISSSGVVTSLTSSVATVPTFPSCNETERFTDGVTLGWGIATVMVMAWCFSMVRRQAR